MEIITVNEAYEAKTTFWSDFSIADIFGPAAIIDTCIRAFKAWREDVEYLAELAIVLNHKIWQWYEKDEEIATVYDQLWRKVDDWCNENLTGEDAEYYFRVTD